MTFKPSKIKTVFFIAVILMLTVIVAAAAGYMLGDTDGDEDVSIIDATRIQRFLAEVPVSGTFYEKAADVDDSGDIEITDVTFIQRWLADIRVPYPIGEIIDEPTEAPTQPTEAPTQPTQPPTQSSTDEEGWGHEIYRP